MTRGRTVSEMAACIAASAVALTVICAGPVLGQTGTASSIQQRQREQERARAMASELASSVLDIQLRQLAENNLQDLPIYAEIQSMRANLTRIVDRDMPDVVAVLVEAQRAGDKEREEHLAAARSRVRSVVVSLMAERQKLAKRMHLARLAAQTRQLIELELKVLGRTRALSGEAPQARERATLATLEDQRDVAAIHFQFVETLADVANWDGPVGAAAAQGLALLRTLQIDRELRGADQALLLSRFADAEKAEQSAIRGWRALLEVIEQTQGLAGSDHETARRMVADLIQRQETVRDQTRLADRRDLQRAEQLAQSEHEIHRDLGILAETLGETAATAALIEQAKAAALAAESSLFEGDTPAAAQQQGEVIGSLAEIEKKLAQAAQSISDKTADELAAEVRQLEQLDGALQPVRTRQLDAAGQAAEQAAAAKAAIDQAVGQLRQANQATDFGSLLETRLSEAEDLLARAQQSLTQSSPELSGHRQHAVAEALQATDVVVAEVKQALADLRRKQMAVSIGELARAAEALERAAAAEHQIGTAARDASAAGGLPAEQAAALGSEQALVQQVARQIAAGVAGTAPQAAQQLNSTDAILGAARQHLQAAQERPGDAGRDALRQAGESARAGSGQLAAAARMLRDQAGLTATQLADLAGQQLKPVESVRAAVDSALAAVQRDDSLPHQQALRQALAHTHAAQREQLRAAGKGAAADARERLDELERTLQQQSTAEEFAREFTQGRANSPLQAATAQKQVGQQIAQATSRADESLAADLQRAQAAAEEAARELVIGNPNTAAAARGAAREALQRAVQTAQRNAEAALQVAPQAADPEAQERVSQRAQTAHGELGAASPDASQALDQARQQSAAASSALANGQEPAASQAQAQTAAALVQTANVLRQALQQASTQETDQARQWAQQAAALSDQALAVDAGAAAALTQATAAAQRAAASPPTAATGSDPQAAVTRGLERAAASLGAREQELQRDQEIAKAIASLAREQQAARDQIAEQAARLEQLAQQPPDAAQPQAPPAEAVDAAQELADASDKFAEALRATGEGAAEISQQREVANQPIRKGLDDASQLAQLPQMNVPPGTPMAPDGQAAAPPVDSHRIGSAADDPGQEGQLRELGTGFVPNSPEETARQIAGKEALEEAAKALAQQPPTAADPLTGEQGKPTQAQVAQNSADPQNSQPAPAETTAAAKKGEAALAADQQGQNQQLDPGMLEQESVAKERDSRTGSGNDTPDPGDRSFQGEPWFAKLPPALQKAIQSKSRSAPPRGYEERLKRYFES